MRYRQQRKIIKKLQLVQWSSCMVVLLPEISCFAAYVSTAAGKRCEGIICIHTECTLTAIHFECAFSQSTFIVHT